MPLTNKRRLHIVTGKMYYDRLSPRERAQIQDMARKIEASTVAIGLGVPSMSGEQSLSLSFSQGNTFKGKYRMSKLSGDMTDSSGAKPADG